MGIQDISKFNDKDLVEFLDSFDTILTDCDGVIWVLGKPYEGAKDVIAAFEALGKRIFYITNNATRTVAQHVSTFGTLGYNVTESQVVTPAVSVAQLLRDRSVTGEVFLLTTSAFRSVIEDAGFRCTQAAQGSMPTWTPDPSVHDMHSHLVPLDGEGVGAVVIDFSATVTYKQLMEASRHLLNPDCLFVAGAVDHDLPFWPKLKLLGPGYIVDLLQSFTRRDPLVAGKPSPVIQQVVAARHPSMKPSRTLFIGDSLTQDVAQGIMSGFITLLVLSGVTTLEEAENAPPERKPQFVAPSLKALLPALQRLISASDQQRSNI